VVLPPLYYTDVSAMRTATGAITIRTEILMDFVTEICDEVGRNGFSKILLVSGHGGNGPWMSMLCNRMLEHPKPYLLYTYSVQLLGGEQNRPLLQTSFDYHGGEVETSIALHLFPELVDPDGRVAATVPASDPDLGGAQSPYAFALRWPRSVSGDPFPATAEKGRVFFESNVDQLVNCMAKVKADTVTVRFKTEFERRCAAPDIP
jgi:creatinine amidohydrolase